MVALLVVQCKCDDDPVSISDVRLCEVFEACLTSGIPDLNFEVMLVLANLLLDNVASDRALGVLSERLVVPSADDGSFPNCAVANNYYLNSFRLACWF